jgi:hypothetical protein
MYTGEYHKPNITANLPLTNGFLEKPRAGCFSCQFYYILVRQTQLLLLQTAIGHAESLML